MVPGLASKGPQHTCCQKISFLGVGKSTFLDQEQPCNCTFPLFDCQFWSLLLKRRKVSYLFLIQVTITKYRNIYFPHAQELQQPTRTGLVFHNWSKSQIGALLHHLLISISSAIWIVKIYFFANCTYIDILIIINYCLKTTTSDLHIF